MVTGVVSGGQTGVDQAALRAAKALRLKTGGYCPQGWKTESGPAPWLEGYGLVEAPSTSYEDRTELNVSLGDITIILGISSAGSDLTQRLCVELEKPCLWLRDFQSESALSRLDIVMSKYTPRILNCAGNRESVCRGIGDAAERWFLHALRRYVGA